MTLTATQIQQITTNCRLDSWQRLGAVFTALHLPAGTGPQVVADWLLQARPTLRTEALRVLLALQRQRWSVEGVPATGLTGASNTGLSASARSGLLIKAGLSTWWLRFAHHPRLQVQAIERFVQQAEGGGR
jgi:hypothetical protein